MNQSHPILKKKNILSIILAIGIIGFLYYVFFAENNPDSVFTIIINSTIKGSAPVLIVSLTLVALSILSLAIFMMKNKDLNKKIKENKKFIELYKENGLIYVDKKLKSQNLKNTGLTGLYNAFHLKLINLANNVGFESFEQIEISNGVLEMSVNSKIEDEKSKDMSLINILSTIGSTAPFIGLVGTTFGILITLSKVSDENITSLIPNISESLFITALGIIVATTSVIMHDLIFEKVKTLNKENKVFRNTLIQDFKLSSYLSYKAHQDSLKDNNGS